MWPVQGQDAAMTYFPAGPGWGLRGSFSSFRAPAEGAGGGGILSQGPVVGPPDSTHRVSTVAAAVCMQSQGRPGWGSSSGLFCRSAAQWDLGGVRGKGAMCQLPALPPSHPAPAHGREKEARSPRCQRPARAYGCAQAQARGCCGEGRGNHEPALTPGSVCDSPGFGEAETCMADSESIPEPPGGSPEHHRVPPRQNPRTDTSGREHNSLPDPLSA